ncbi:hypothetical protein YTXLTZUM_CDS0193 [Enterococcus phage VRE9_3]
MRIIFGSLMLIVILGMMLFIIGYSISEAWYRRRIYNHDPKLMDRKETVTTINNRVTKVVMFRSNQEASEKIVRNAYSAISWLQVSILDIYLIDSDTNEQVCFSVVGGRINNHNYPLTDSEILALELSKNFNEENLNKFLDSEEVKEKIDVLDRSIIGKELV